MFNVVVAELAVIRNAEEREIVIPVEIGDASTGLRRYKLSLKLRLDSLDRTR